MNVSNNYSFQYGFLFEREAQFDVEFFLKSMKTQWILSLPIGFLYLILLYVSRQYMHFQQEGFGFLNTPLIIWNLCLAVFSIFGAWFRLVPEMIYCLRNHGFMYSVCDDGGRINNALVFWIYLFTLSKVFELGDTAFIVLRKRKLNFLHWIHHTLTLIHTWYSVAQENPSGRWFICLNFVAHSFMYSYYFFMAMKFRVPKWVSIFITSLQLGQMVMGCYVNYVCYVALKNNVPCVATMDSIIFSTLTYIIYFILFSNFFWKTYVKAPSAKIKSKKN